MNNFYRRVFAKKISYDGIEFDSKMEADFYKFMKDNDISISRNYSSWKLLDDLEYNDWFIKYKVEKRLTRASEKQTLSGRNYTPDFIIERTNTNLIIEVKGKQFINDWNKSRTELLFRKYLQDNKCDCEYIVIRTHDDFIPLLAYIQCYEGKIKDFVFNGKVRNDWDKINKVGGANVI